MALAKGFVKLKRWVAVLLLLAAVVVGGFMGFVQQFASQPMPLPADGTTVIIEPGDHFGMVLAKLRGAGIDQGNDLEWKVLATTMRVASRLQAGEYLLSGPITPRALLLKFARGDVVRYRFTIIEGRNFRELRAALTKDKDLRHDLPQLSDAEVMAALGRDGQSPEGRFLPETYQYRRGISDIEILRMAMQAMDTVLAKSWSARASDLPLASPEELLTLASIVEKETGNAEERPLIASVFVHRLKLGMRLQTDPTVIYGMGSAYDGNIRKQDLETDTPYNTYTRAGLPPTPITMPGTAAIEAAAHPAEGSALYFVARGDGSGRHVFAASYAEHFTNINKYQLKR